MKTKFLMGAAVMLLTSLPDYEACERNKARDVPEPSDESADGLLAGISFEGHAPIEAGHVIGISVYANGALPSYLVRYRAGNGMQTEAWHSEDALIADPSAASGLEAGHRPEAESGDGAE